METTKAEEYVMINKDPDAGTKYDFPRDSVGYGEQGLKCDWPGKKKIALSFVLNYEEGGERSLSLGDECPEWYMYTSCRDGPSIARDYDVETEYDYGSRCGVWRMIRLFKKHNLKLTAYAVGKAFECNPEAAKAFVRDGHEIASHAYRWIPYDDLSPEKEKGLILKQIDTLQKTTGLKTFGWYMGRLSAHSIALIVETYRELGLPLPYISDNYADDVPYWTDVPQEKSLPDSEKKGLLYVPYNLDCNDYRFLRPCGWRSEEDYYQHLVNSFDVLYGEGGKIMTVGLHCRIMGKPGYNRALERFIEYVEKKPDVWICTRSQIADWFKAKYPYKPGHKAD
ncbi:polysaccharide deacetylase [Brettanomyces bruxellensis AWRI1499]|uniref:DEBR0S5_00210g1_1 n=1 Tax=Dekkera bruxellensis TaxID=5007 RepID=A0A7D9CZW9_DEKBR|nr:polysaccharide deacetylase [Brettanomyces bruxellensis AWRI1499]VUG19336.1 cda1 [Brettanomyces bruxellensis]